jgi:hypothetical protein
VTQEQKIKQAARLAAPVFAAMGWTWAMTGPHTPNIEEIEKAYRELASHLKDGNDYCGSGRLSVRKSDLGTEFSMELA